MPQRVHTRNAKNVIEATQAPVKTIALVLSRHDAIVRLEYPERLATTPRLTPAQVRVLLVLWRRAYAQGEAWPRQTYIADLLELSPCEISRALSNAAVLGLVQVIRGQRGVRYRLPWHPEFTPQGDSTLVDNPRLEASPLAEKRKSGKSPLVQNVKSGLRKSASGERSTLYSSSKVETESSSSSVGTLKQPAAAVEHELLKAEPKPAKTMLLMMTNTRSEPTPPLPSQPSAEGSQVELAKAGTRLDLRRACRQVVNGPVSGNVLRQIEDAAGEDHTLMAEFLATKKGIGRTEAFLVYLSTADEWPTWRDDQKATVQAADREREEQRRRDERLALMVPCPKCKGAQAGERRCTETVRI